MDEKRAQLLRRGVFEWNAMMDLIEHDDELVAQFERWNEANDNWVRYKLSENG